MFSVIVPLYNKRDTVSKAVASVLAQSFADFELIVVDDGSTDGGPALLVGVKDPRLRVISQQNRGVGAARNAGAAAARHDWIAFLDADDFWFEDHLEELDRVRHAFPDSGLIGTRYLIGAPARHDGKARGAGRIERIDYIAEVATGRIVLISSSAAVRRDVWEKTGGFGSFPNGQDSELWVRIAARWPVAVSRRVTVAYRQWPGGISDRKRRDWIGRPPRSLAELSPAAARVLELRVEAPEPRRKTYDAYVDRHLHWRLRAAISDRDLVTIREIRRLYERRPSPVDSALLWIGLLPGPLALFLYRAGRFS